MSDTMLEAGWPAHYATYTGRPYEAIRADMLPLEERLLWEDFGATAPYAVLCGEWRAHPVTIDQAQASVASLTRLLDEGRAREAADQGTYERALARVQGYAHLKVGWYEGLAQGRERYTMGGPVEQVGIDEVCEVIAWCQAHGVAAPSVTPAPRSDMTSGVSLEWDAPDVWAEWMAPGVWELVAPGHGGLAASGEDVIRALEVGND